MSKQALKAAKTCIDSNDWAEAETQCRKVLSFDPQSYAAYLNPRPVVFFCFKTTVQSATGVPVQLTANRTGICILV